MKEELTEEEIQKVTTTYNVLKGAGQLEDSKLTVEDLIESSRIDKFYSKTKVKDGIEFTHIATQKSFKIYEKDYGDRSLAELSPFVNEKVRKFEYVEL